MKRYVLSFIAIIIFGYSYSSNVLTGYEANDYFTGASKVYLKTDFNTPLYIEFAENSQPTESSFFQALSERFNVNEALTFVEYERYTDQLGILHKRFRQHMNGVPIHMAQYSVHLKSGKVTAASGKFYANIKAAKAMIEESKALSAALADFKAEAYKWEIPQEEQFLKWESDDPNATFFPEGQLVYFGKDASPSAQDIKLCYAFNVYAQKPIGRRKYYIDAQDGQIVFIENLLHSANKSAQATTAYSGVRTIVSDSLNPFAFRLRETTRGNGIETYDMNNNTQYNQAVDFIDSNNVWDTFNPGINRYSTDAHWGTEMTYDYFSVIHSRNSIDNFGFTLRSYVHYSTNYVNAFWDGQRMTYGDGDATTNPLTTLDITGHEVAHGLTNFTSGLIYANESGALNESFSDIFGVAVEQFARNGNWNWTMGEEIGMPFRSLSNPKSYGDPDTYGGINWINQNCFPTGGNDWCGVHTNSGVQNHWFYLLSEGISGVNDNGDSFTVDSLGIIDAGKVAFRNNTVYLTASSDHEEARFFSIVSAVNLFGACSPEVEAVTDAWYAVGVGEAYTPGVDANFIARNDTSFCSVPATVQFESDGNNVLQFFWDFGDGTTSNLPNPVKIYTNYGQYTVRLIGDGGTCGRDTTLFTNYINIDSNNTCSSLLNAGMNFSSDCQGVIFDQGGLNGDYPNNASDTLVVNPSSGDIMQIDFPQFDLEAGFGGNCNHDYVEIFDGPNTNAPSLGRYCNNNIPTSSILTTTGSFTMVMNSDAKVEKAGFRMSWSCLNASSTPTAAFTASVDTTCNGSVTFKDQSTGGVNSWLWDFGDGSTSTLRNPSHSYLLDGSYTVKLKVGNSMGQDSIITANAVVVNRGVHPLVGGDTVCVGGDAKLWASGIADLLWYNSATSERAVHRGDTLNLTGIQSSQTYYVASSPPVSSQTVVPFVIPGGSTFFTDTAEAIYFNVFEPMVLETVILRSNSSGFRRIDLKDKNGTIINSVNAFISGSGGQATLNFELSPDSNYQLTIGSREPGLMVNSTGASYPYTAAGLMEITGSSLGANAYPFFYFMRVKAKRCETSRKEVRAFVDTTCIITNTIERSINKDKVVVYPNPMKDLLIIEGDLSKVKQLRIYNVTGKLLFERSIGINSNRLELTELASYTDGIYFVELQGDNQLQRKKVLKVSR